MRCCCCCCCFCVRLLLWFVYFRQPIATQSLSSRTHTHTKVITKLSYILVSFVVMVVVRFVIRSSSFIHINEIIFLVFEKKKYNNNNNNNNKKISEKNICWSYVLYSYSTIYRDIILLAWSFGIKIISVCVFFISFFL